MLTRLLIALRIKKPAPKAEPLRAVGVEPSRPWPRPAGRTPMRPMPPPSRVRRESYVPPRPAPAPAPDTSSSDLMNTVLLASMLNQHSSPACAPDSEPVRFVSGCGGDFGGAGASGSWDAPSPAPSPSYEAPAPSPAYEAPAPSPSYDSGSSYSSDSGSSSSYSSD
jgi:hypothetical protein